MRLPAVLLVLLLLAGCGGPGARGETAAAGSRGSRAAPVTRAKAGLVLRDLAPLRGFAAAAYCLDGRSARCDLPGDPLWTEHAEWRGPQMGHGSAGADAPRAFYLVGVLVHRRPDAARGLVRDVERRSPAGPVHERAQVEDDRTYTFGRQGRAVVRSTRVGDWTGVVSVGRVDLLRPHERPVHDVVQVDATLHRGRVSVQVIAWLDGRSPGPDPAVTLDALTQRVLRRLDLPYAALLRGRSGAGATAGAVARHTAGRGTERTSRLSVGTSATSPQSAPRATIASRPPSSASTPPPSTGASGIIAIATNCMLAVVPANQASFHLRQLGKYALVEKAPELARDGRDRVWRATHDNGLDIDTRTLADAPGGRAAVTVFRRSWTEAARDAVRRAAEPHPAGGAVIVSDTSLRLTAEEAQRLSGEIGRLVDGWRVRGRDHATDDDEVATYQLLSILQPARSVATDPTDATGPAGP